MGSGYVLCVNAGSSSLKFAAFEVSPSGLEPLLSGCFEGLEPGGAPVLKGVGSTSWAPQPGEDAFESASSHLPRLLAEKGLGKPLALAHRVVHGGTKFSTPMLVGPSELEQLRELCPLAPLHQPRNVQGLASLGEAFDGVPAVACFDTAFHAGMPREQAEFHLPPSFWDSGMRRYGFHGLAYQSAYGILSARSEACRGRLIAAHLGNGASVCAMSGGRSVSTTMGFSTIDGLMMGTRCGRFDPGALLWMLDNGFDSKSLSELLYKGSGLKGMGGRGADMRGLREAASCGDERAARALASYSARLAQECAGLLPAIGGLDALAFSGGVGENDAQARLSLCRSLEFAGVKIDPELNAAGLGASDAAPIHAPGSSVEVWICRIDENRVAAKQALEVIGIGLDAR